MKPLHFCNLAYISAITSVLWHLLEASKSPVKVKIQKMEDFEYILSWEAENVIGTPTYYTVMYKNMSSFPCNLPTARTKVGSKRGQEQDYAPIISGFKIVRGCTNVTESFCNLTTEFAGFCIGYTYLIVKQVTKNGVNYSDVLLFNPYVKRCLRPPQFNISTCQNCVTITVKLSSLLLKVYQELSGVIILTTADLTQKSRFTAKNDSFSTVLEDLQPNKNYCIAVNISTDQNQQCTPSIPKCIMTDSKYRQGPVIPLLVAVLISLILSVSLVILRMTGYICFKREKWPDVLKFRSNLMYSVFGSALEKVDIVQITPEGESKGQQYSEDEDSESDTESNVETKSVILNNISKSSFEVGVSRQLSIDCSASANEVTGNSKNTGEKNQNVVGQGSQLYPSGVNSTTAMKSEQNSCLNINLNTVKLGILSEKWDFSTEFDQEDVPVYKESCTSDAYEPNHFTKTADNQSFIVQSPSHSWEDLSASGESEFSDSGIESSGGYMKR